jgi:glycyl-tRNA synthetase
MSLVAFGLGGLRIWTSEELSIRRAFEECVTGRITKALTDMNPAWAFYRCEGPCLMPRDEQNEAYTDADVFVTNHEAGENTLSLRAETTLSSYLYARILRKQYGKKLPLCVYQSGKSFRRELNDGATGEKLRFNEFNQLEFQCIYSTDTKADYRVAVLSAVENEINRFTCMETRQQQSDRLPVYSESTIDIEVEMAPSKWMEIASLSIRKDFEDAKVLEIAIGLDRVASLA